MIEQLKDGFMFVLLVGIVGAIWLSSRSGGNEQGVEYDADADDAGRSDARQRRIADIDERLDRLRPAERSARSDREDAASDWSRYGTINFRSAMNHEEGRHYDRMQETESRHEEIKDEIYQLEKAREKLT